MSKVAAGASGGCLCGAVRYRVRGPLRPVINCHCEQCRRSSGHHVAATACRRQHLELIEPHDLRWYTSSETARRGFCGTCGSSVFWDSHEPERQQHVSIMAGTLDQPTGLETAANIYTDFAGDYYHLDDDVPGFPVSGHGVPFPD